MDAPPSATANGDVLRVEGVSKSFGGVQAVGNCNMTVAERSITGLIGPNGSGKTTLFNVITGMVQANAGATYFRGRNILGLGEARPGQWVACTEGLDAVAHGAAIVVHADQNALVVGRGGVLRQRPLAGDVGT